MLVVHTGPTGNIKIVKTKLVSVFASKFTPYLDAGTLKEKLVDHKEHKDVLLSVREY